MPRASCGEVLISLRRIRDASIADVVDAMYDRWSELKDEHDDLDISIPTIDDLVRLEMSQSAEISVESVFLLAYILGVGLQDVFWFVDLIYPEAEIPRHPAESLWTNNGWNMEEQTILRFMDVSESSRLFATSTEAAEFYRRSGLVEDSNLRVQLLNRFLRPPFRLDRYQIAVVGSTDADLSPRFMPGTIALLDTECRIPPYDIPDVGGSVYWCFTGKKHRCGWPINKHNRVVLKSVDNHGEWTELERAVILGTPVSVVWHANERRTQDFFMPDYRNGLTREYIALIRSIAS